MGISRLGQKVPGIHKRVACRALEARADGGTADWFGTFLLPLPYCLFLICQWRDLWGGTQEIDGLGTAERDPWATMMMALLCTRYSTYLLYFTFDHQLFSLIGYLEH